MQGTLVLSGSTTFKGFLLLNPPAGQGTLNGVAAPGAAFQSCGFGHTEASAKSSISFTYTPSLYASSVTFQLFVVGSQTQWWNHQVRTSLMLRHACSCTRSDTRMPRR